MALMAAVGFYAAAYPSRGAAIATVLITSATLVIGGISHIIQTRQTLWPKLNMLAGGVFVVWGLFLAVAAAKFLGLI